MGMLGTEEQQLSAVVSANCYKRRVPSTNIGRRVDNSRATTKAEKKSPDLREEILHLFGATHIFLWSPYVIGQTADHYIFTM